MNIIKVLLSGISGGIGTKICEILLRGENEVIGIIGKSHALDFQIKDSRVKLLKIDLSDKHQVIQLCDSSELEGVQAFIHCAGVANVARMGEIDSEKLEKMFFLNSISPILLINRLLPKMVEDGFGRIVLIGSIVGDFGGVGLSGYSSTKSSLSALNRSINKEIQLLKKKFPSCDVTTNLVKPGYCDSKMTSDMNTKLRSRLEESSTLKRFLKCEEVAHEISRLILSEASYISGSEISINGGQTP